MRVRSDRALERARLGVEPAREELDEPWRPHHAERRHDDEREQRRAPHAREEPARRVVSLLRSHLREHRHHRARRRAFAEKRPQRVRNGERDPEGVGLGPREERGQRLIARQTEQPRHERARPDDARASGQRPSLLLARRLGQIRCGRSHAPALPCRLRCVPFFGRRAAAPGDQSRGISGGSCPSVAGGLHSAHWQSARR